MAFVVCSVILWCCPVGRGLARLSRCRREQVASLRPRENPQGPCCVLDVGDGTLTSVGQAQPCHQKWRNEWLEKALGHPRSSEDACGRLDKEQEVKCPKDSGEAFKMSFPSDSLLTRLLTRPEALRFAVMTFKSLLG